MQLLRNIVQLVTAPLVAVVGLQSPRPSIKADARLQHRARANRKIQRGRNVWDGRGVEEIELEGANLGRPHNNEGVLGEHRMRAFVGGEGQLTGKRALKFLGTTAWLGILAHPCKVTTTFLVEGVVGVVGAVVMNWLQTPKLLNVAAILFASAIFVYVLKKAPDAAVEEAQIVAEKLLLREVSAWLGLLITGSTAAGLLVLPAHSGCGQELRDADDSRVGRSSSWGLSKSEGKTRPRSNRRPTPPPPPRAVPPSPISLHPFRLPPLYRHLL